MNVPSVDDIFRRVLKANVYEIARETPLEKASRLSRRLGNEILLKREDQQPVFSFKLRGAYNKMVSLSESDRAKGVICSSAGNHAQGVAMSGKTLGCATTIVMPVTTPTIKVQAVEQLGGTVVLHGESYDEAQEYAMELASSRGFTYVHPYDDQEVIAGQGTIGMEILRQMREVPDVVFVPVGGGGLISGIGAYIKHLYPEVRIIGVEPHDAASMKASLDAGAAVRLDQVGLFADGVAVKQVGATTLALCKQVVDGIVTVSTDEICASIKDIYEDTRTIMEPAGALALAGCKTLVEREGIRNRNLVVLACGSNMNFDRLRHVAERAELGENREALFGVTLQDVPGAFRSFCQLLGDRNVTEFNFRTSGLQDAHVFVGVETPREGDRLQFLAHLRGAGVPTEDLSDSELAKLHLRYLVGGRSEHAEGERVFRFAFPERPGALKRFLDALPDGCNISLFHYRNHGADVGRVLVGFRIPRELDKAFETFLATIGYDFVEETANTALQLFL